MPEDAKKPQEAPDLVRNYRPVAIRSVLAAHAMIPRHKPAATEHEPISDTGFSLPAGFYTVPED